MDPEFKLAARGDLVGVKQLLAVRPELLNAMSDGHHRTLPWEAANANRMELVEYLLKIGADPDIPGRYRSETFVLLTPYTIVRKKNRHTIAELLLARGTGLDVYSAAFLGEVALLEEMVGRRPCLVNVRHPDDSAWNVLPLHYAITGGQTEAAKFLISKGTSLSGHSELLFDIACRLGRMDLIQLLVGSGADPARAEAFSVVYTGSPQIMDFFFTRGVDVNEKGRVTGWPPIAYVSRGDKGEHPERVRSLVGHGAAVDATGPKGATALHAAAKAGFCSVIAILLDAGADINAKTDRGETPLDLANKNKRREASELLRSRNC